MKSLSLWALMLALVFWVPVSGHALTPDEAGEHVGQTGAVDGLVAAVASSPKGHMFINFGAAYPNHVFTGWVPAGAVKVFGADYLKSLQGKKVSLVGTIKLYKGKPEIILTKRDQIIEVK